MIDLRVDGEAINFIQSLTLPATIDGNFILEMKGLVPVKRRAESEAFGYDDV